jgi:two-component sensor histidine kinase
MGGPTQRLEQELRDARERLQATIKEHESAVSKLAASNEGLRSKNAQLQSSNKELEIANAALRSANQDLESAEARQRALIEQLNHRVGNILTVISAMANQTLARADSPDHFAAAFLGRLNSMSRLSTRCWRGRTGAECRSPTS